MEQIWDENNIVIFHRNTIMEQLGQDASNDLKAAVYAREIESMKKKNAPIQKTMHGIIAREACLKNIADLQAQVS